MNESTELWLRFAREDLAAARAVAKEALYNQVCFHAQQCAEKSLKAIVAGRGVVPPRVHALTDLLNHIPEPLFAGLRNEIADLDDFYIPTRYPDAVPGAGPDSLPGEEDAAQALALAGKIILLTEEYLKN